MDKSTAERWVTISALLVIAIYGYRRITEPTASPTTLKNVVGVGNPAPLGAFATAWGFCFLVVAMMAEAAPGFGGAFAILIATTDFLANAPAVLSDVGSQEKKTGTGGSSSGSTNASQTAAELAAAQLPHGNPGTEPAPSSVGGAINRPSTLPFVGSHGN